MLIAQSLRRKILVTLVVVAGVLVYYQATIFDSRFSTRQVQNAASGQLTPADLVIAEPYPALSPTVPVLRFVVTAYCRGTTTASGVVPRSGIAAADPELLPVGSVIQVSSLGPRYDGIYTILDTGPKVQGRLIDIYLWNCDEAVMFGRRAAAVVVLRLGWNPRDTAPTLFDRLLGRRERAADGALPGPKR